MPRGVYERKKDVAAGETPPPVIDVVSAPTAEIRVRPRDVRDMNRGELQAYAGEIGVLPRDRDLPNDRLRQNIMAMLAEQYE